MFAVKSSADDGRYASVTRNLSPGRVVRCPNCSESYIVYTITPSLANRACASLSEYLTHQCPHHVEFFATDDKIKTHFVLSQYIVVVDFDRRDANKIVKEFSEWLESTKPIEAAMQP